MARFRIHTNWTDTVRKVRAFGLEDLADGATRDLLRSAFLEPGRLRPQKTRQILTEQAAAKVAALAQRLRGRGHAAPTVAHVVNRLVFCMFAKEMRLLPGHMSRRMPEQCQARPAEFEDHARTLFGAMRAGGRVGFERVAWFNGGLFDGDAALALDRTDLSDLLEAARLDESDIDSFHSPQGRLVDVILTRFLQDHRPYHRAAPNERPPCRSLSGGLRRTSPHRNGHPSIVEAGGDVGPSRLAHAA